MSIATRMTSLAAVLAVVAGAALASASPAAAKNYPYYKQQQAWHLVDQNRDGAISKKEWKWAEKHGYDRLNGVPKKHLTRAEYQRYFDQYLSYRYGRNAKWDNDDRDDGPRWQKARDTRDWDGRDWWQNQQGNEHGEHGGGYGRGD